MATQIEYVKDYHSDCSALWGEPSSEPVRSLLSDWGIEVPASVGELEDWYGKAHPVNKAKIPIPVPTDIHGRFIALAREWVRGTEKHSNLTKIVMHPAYQQIIAMGPAVIPEIIRLMMKGPDHWFWALRALTQGQDPAEGLSTMRAATDAWIEWGKEYYDLG